MVSFFVVDPRRIFLLLGLLAVLLLSTERVCVLCSVVDAAEDSDPAAASGGGSTCDAPSCDDAGATKTANTKGAAADVLVLPIITDDFKTVPELPDMTNGGIMVYFHLYKTGGSSITELMVELKAELEGDDDEDEDNATVIAALSAGFVEGEKLIFVNNREDMTEEDIEWSVQEATTKKKPVFYNFHVQFPATMYPTLVEAAPVLRQWRAAATAAGIPFFATTTLREPLGHALSFFNFFHVYSDEQEWSPFAGDMDPTEENFLDTFVGNRLCHLMYDDAHGILEAPAKALREGLTENLFHFMDEDELSRRDQPSKCDVDALRAVLFDNHENNENTPIFDYVGVTERLSTHILPMLTAIIFGDARLAADAETKKKAVDMTDDTWVPLAKSALSEDTKAFVAKESAKDQMLYEEARDRFAHWPSYL